MTASSSWSDAHFYQLVAFLLDSVLFPSFSLSQFPLSRLLSHNVRPWPLLPPLLYLSTRNPSLSVAWPFLTRFDSLSVIGT